MKKVNLVKELEAQNLFIKLILKSNKEKAESIWRMYTTMIARLRNCNCLSDKEYYEMWGVLNKGIMGTFRY